MSKLQIWGKELGFSQIGITDIDLSYAEEGLINWLSAGFHGNMNYMALHGLKRARPSELLPETISIITARMDYFHFKNIENKNEKININESINLDLSENNRGDFSNWAQHELDKLNDIQTGVVSIYAKGRDYHKIMRGRLQKLAQRLSEEITPLGFRVFTDSAPVLEAELAAKSGQGWRGKHTLILNRESGSLFFLGEIFVNVQLPSTQSVQSHCGKCQACLDICPTKAIVAPYRLDARRCISYLTIELDGAIPLEFRSAIGNRIYGCDDCQLVCPWNKFAKLQTLPDFEPRQSLNNLNLLDLLNWNEAEFLQRTEGTAIRRIGHLRWLRNVSLAAGNALKNTVSPLSESEKTALQNALRNHQNHPSEIIQEQIAWSLS